ncbi:MAG: CcmD family protein [Acidimicrobiia bacterium]|nr:CcmD family protein [Acidimicrobiia bacterium]
MDERNFTYMFYGFAAAWAILALYVLVLVSREKRIESQIDNLKRMLDAKENKS